MNTSPVARRRGFCRLVLAPALLLPLLVVSAADARESDLEPLPPAVFFRDPDTATDDEIRVLVSNSFGDPNKARDARAQLVYRYHMWGVKQLVTELTAGTRSQSGLWNSLLTVAAQRDVWGPAPGLRPLIGPVNRMMGSAEPWRRAFASLALGCFHWPQADTPNPKVRDQLAEDTTAKMTRELGESVRLLGAAIDDDNFQVRVAALLALAKRGGSAARNALLNGLAQLEKGTPYDVWAGLIARGFLQPRDGKPLRDALTSDESRRQRAAALGFAVTLLCASYVGPADGSDTDWAAWIGDGDLDLLRKIDPNNNQAFPEAVFARGVYAHTRQAGGEWKRLWEVALHPKSKEAAIAAAQALLFCEERGWFLRDVLEWASRSKGGNLDEPVLAAFLLLAAQTGTTEGVNSAAAWLGNGARPPKGTRHFDVRFHAAVGLLRALHYGDIKKPEDRAAALTALRKGVRQLHEKAPFRAALEAVLDEHEARLLKNDFDRLPDEALRAVEDSFVCPYALLSRDLVDVCVHRVNQTVIGLFNLNRGNPAEDGTPQRFLRAYLDEFPYFSRLEFHERRGARPLPSAGQNGIDK